MATDEQDLGERIRRIIAVLAGEVDRRVAPSGQDPSILDAAARSLGATIGRWGQSPGLRRFVGGVQRDVLTSRGEWVELSAHLGIAAKLGSVARFYIDDAVVGEVPIGKNVGVLTVVRAPGPGLYRVGVKVYTATGSVVSDLIGDRILQVASGRPVVLVDGDLLLSGADAASSPTPKPLGALRALVDEGFELAYFDIHEKNRASLIRDALRAQRLPPGAVLIYSAEEEELKSLGLDFVEMFGLTAVRRLRATGVPVTMILSNRTDGFEQDDSKQAQIMTPEEAARRARAGDLTREFDQAARLLRERNATDPLTWRLDQSTGSTLVCGNSFHAELDNARAREALFGAIDSAVSSIHIQFYMVKPSAFAEKLIVKLIQQARAGVHVRFMVDALYSDEGVLGRANPLILSLKAESNIDVLALSPIESPKDVDVQKLKKRDHRKLVVIDGKCAFVSGRNASDEYFYSFDEVPIHDNTPHERIPWLDAHIEVRGPLVRQVQRTFMETWEHQGGEEIPVDDQVLPELSPDGSAAGRLVVHRSFEDTNGLAMYEAILDLADSHVYIVNDFPIVTALERAIYRLLARDVSVKLLTGNAAARRDDGTFFPAPLHRTAFEYMVKAKLEPLLRAGVQVYEFVPPPSPIVVARGGRVRPYVHAKLVSVDGKVTSIGSANLDATASFWESEANIVVQDSAFSASVEAILQELIDGSVELDPESDYWKRERAQRAVVDTLWPGTFYS
jgi:phosphatidylserine/phosphatidylglycerophosphate/cardiolipin synthase-like enzyme